MSKTYDLSIVIPALREEFLKNTVENIIENKRGATEVIVVLDGEWADPPLADHPDVRIIYSANRGQRGATNLGVKLSKAKYVAKTDAHCAFDEGFDVKLMDALKGHDNWTIVPAMKNLHVFNWVCSNCGTEYYQGEKPDKCPDELCQFIDTTFDKKIYFVPRGEMGSSKSKGPTSTAYRFTPDRLQFKYFGALKGYQDKEGEVAETMSLQGSFFMLTREKYNELNICDETWGGWGQQGTEVALKTKLSGGKAMVHRGTWYAHMFRTNNQLAFPWNKDLKESQGSQQHRARAASVDLFFNSRWEHQIYPLSKVVEDFWEPLQNESYGSDELPWTEDLLNEQKQRECKSERSGIYSITSKATGRVYVGSAINIANRIFEHTRKLKQKDHRNIHLQRTYDKYGEGDLTFSVLYFCSPENLIENEQRFIDEYKDKIGWDNLFNINPTAGSTLGCECSDETKAKISASKIGTEAWNKGLTKDTDTRLAEVSASMKGKKVYEEHPRGMLGKHHAEETKLQVSESMKPVAELRERDKNGHFIKTGLTKGILYFTDNELPLKYARPVQKRLKQIAQDKSMELVSSSRKPMGMGKNVVVKGERGYLQMFRQILAGLNIMTSEIVFMAEHDCLYPPEHFDFTPTDHKFYYDINWYKIHEDGVVVRWKADQVSGLCAYRETLLNYYRQRLAEFNPENFDRKFEPMSGEKSEQWESPVPYIDIRHGRNLTYNKRSLEHFRKKETAVDFKTVTIEDIPGWSNLSDIIKTD